MSAGVIETSEGTRVEWDADGWDWSVDLDRDGTVFIHGYHAATDADVWHEAKVPR